MARLPQQLEEARSFAREDLGPSCCDLLHHPEVQALVLSRVRGGFDPKDAVLAEVHARMDGNGELANEFLAFFLGDLYRLGRPMISPGLHRFLDTWDLAQSVLGDLWPGVASIEFRGRKEFLSLLAQRLRWKSTDSARKSGRTRETSVMEESGSGHVADGIPAQDPSPASEVAARDEQERMILTLLRLGERDRRLVQAHLKGASIETVMEEMNLGYEAARKAQQRAIQRARELLQRRVG